MHISILQYALSMSVYIILLYLMHEVFRRHVFFSTCFSILALLSFPLWFIHLDGWFRWGKTLLVLVPTCFLNFVRLSHTNKFQVLNFLKSKWSYVLLYLVLFANIIEASLKDISLGNWFNGLAGFILCITIPLPKFAWSIDNQHPQHDLIAKLPLAWSLLYTTWNAAFVFGENITYFASTLCILIVPIIRCFINHRTDLWMSARAYTLAIHILIRATLGDIFYPLMNTSTWGNDSILSFWHTLNFFLCLGYGIYFYINNKKNKLKLPQVHPINS